MEEEDIIKTYVYYWIKNANKHFSINIAIADLVEKKLIYGGFLDSRSLVDFEHILLKYLNDDLGKSLVKGFVQGGSHAERYVVEFVEKLYGTNHKGRQQDILKIEDARELVSKATGQSMIMVDEEVIGSIQLLGMILFENFKGSNMRFICEELNTTSNVKLDIKAIMALGIVSPDIEKASTLEAGYYQINQTLFGVMNRCKTKMGARKLKRWILQPKSDKGIINRRLDMVETISNEEFLQVILSQNLEKVSII